MTAAASRSVGGVRHALAALALAIAASSCSDGPAGVPRGNLARVAFTPRFARGPASSDQTVDFGLSFDRVRVVVRRPPSQIVVDTTVSFTPGDADLSLDLQVTTVVDNEAFDVLLEYRDGDRVLFQGSATVVAQPIDAEPAAGATIEVLYVGPGADAAQLTIDPRPIALFTATTTQLSAKVVNASGAAVSDVPINWSIDDPTLATLSSTTGATTELQANDRRGVVTVVARTPTGIAGQAAILIVPTATSLELSAGDAQAGIVDALLGQPIVVRAVDDAGLPVPNTVVTWSAVNGVTSVATSTTDISGIASTTLRLGTLAGPSSVTATISVGATTKQVVFSATAAAGPVATLSFDAQPASAIAGAVLAPVVKVRLLDAFGNAVTAPANVTLSLTGGVEGATLGGTTTAATAGGVASFSNLIITRMGTAYRLAASVGAVTVTSAAFDIAAGAPALIEKVAGDARTVVAGTVIDVAPSVRVLDAFGNTVSGVPVVFAPADEGSGSVSGGAVTTDANGIATVGTWTVGNEMGPSALVAAAGTVSTTFIATVTGGVPAGIRLAVGALGSASTITATRNTDIVVPITLDLTSRGGVDLASIAVTLSWEPTAFTFKELTGTDGWRDSQGVVAAVTTNTIDASRGSIRIAGFTTSATVSSFVLVNLVFTANATGTVTASITAAGNVLGDRITVTPRPQTITVVP
jgi:adhesin/invasin